MSQFVEGYGALSVGPKVEIPDEHFHVRHDELESASDEDPARPFLPTRPPALIHSKGPEPTDEPSGGPTNATLTLQTLNADGTPKRPMNAFMIFARRRRPQLSSHPENATLRTGEISKRLSIEWNVMEPTDKQFYLDQAKLLKETFNTKYPDYVYRRRPNNSRKKRRPDSSSSAREDESPSSVTDDGSVIKAEPLTTTPLLIGQEQAEEDVKPDFAYQQPHPEVPSSQYSNQPPYPEARSLSRSSSSSSRPTPYDYPSDRLQRGSIGRLPYLTATITGNRVTVSSPASPNIHSAHPSSQSYPSYAHNHSPGAYPASEHEYSGHQGYIHNPRVDWAPHDHASAPMAIQGTHYSTNSQRWSDAISPSSNTSLSPSAPSLSSVGSRSSSMASRSPNFPFPTLNTPYNPEHGHGDFHGTSSPSTHYAHLVPAPREHLHDGHYESERSLSRKSSRESTHGTATPYETRSYMSSPSTSPIHPYSVPTFLQNTGEVHASHPQISSGMPIRRSMSMQQNLGKTAVQTQYPQHPAANSGPSSLSAMAYWWRGEGAQ